MHTLLYATAHFIRCFRGSASGKVGCSPQNWCFNRLSPDLWGVTIPFVFLLPQRNFVSRVKFLKGREVEAASSSNRQPIKTENAQQLHLEFTYTCVIESLKLLSPKHELAQGKQEQFNTQQYKQYQRTKQLTQSLAKLTSAFPGASMPKRPNREGTGGEGSVFQKHSDKIEVTTQPPRFKRRAIQRSAFNRQICTRTSNPLVILGPNHPVLQRSGPAFSTSCWNHRNPTHSCSIRATWSPWCIPAPSENLLPSSAPSSFEESAATKAKTSRQTRVLLKGLQVRLSMNWWV